MSSVGRVSANTRKLICDAVACNSRTAVKGSARKVICEPKRDTVEPAHSFKKFGCRQSPAGAEDDGVFIVKIHFSCMNNNGKKDSIPVLVTTVAEKAASLVGC